MKIMSTNMKKEIRQLTAYTLTFVLLAVSCVIPTVASAGSRTESDPAQAEYRYLIETEFASCPTSTVGTVTMGTYVNNGSKPRTITRNCKGTSSSWSTSLGAHAALGDLSGKPSDYNVSKPSQATVSAYVLPRRRAIFIGYKQKSTWTWRHNIKHQHRKANSTEWETLDTSTSYSTITKNFMTFGSKIQ